MWCLQNAVGSRLRCRNTSWTEAKWKTPWDNYGAKQSSQPGPTTIDPFSGTCFLAEYVFSIIQMNLWASQTVWWLRKSYFYSKESHLFEPPRRTPYTPSRRQHIHQRRKISSNLSLQYFPLIWTICLHFYCWRKTRECEVTNIRLTGENENQEEKKNSKFFNRPSWSLYLS